MPISFRDLIRLRRTLCRGCLPWLILAMLAGSAGFLPAAAAFYRPGDVVDNFTLVNRATRQPVRLSDLEGKIVFLEWFAWWCPYCQAAAPQVEAGIVEWYTRRGGNPAGIPVLHVAVNLQPGQEAQTQNFVDRAGFEFVLEDFNRALANRFQSGGQPIFAIINGVAGSPTHRPWELLAHQDGYGQRDFSESLNRFRAVIDAVQAAPPIVAPRITQPLAGGQWTEGDTLQLSLGVEGTEPLAFTWFRDAIQLPAVMGATLSLSPVTLEDSGHYHVEVMNAAGRVASEPARVLVQRRVPPTPKIVGVRTVDAARLAVAIQDAGGLSPTLEVSVDLQDWQPAANLSATSAIQEVVVPLGERPWAFFRVRNR
ncbi:MAG: redoxin domain-containing protein [Verrucomicrobiales bacterium]|nr:redoxin domain-containing protein [Verrucomicrobiales bacterium]